MRRTHPTTDQRLAQVRDLLTALGSLDSWPKRIKHLLVHVAHDRALMAFLADAPFAVLFLLTVIANQEQEIRRLKTMERSV